ncbi:hypothetical protein [Demequina silvatica]|uniref:hypothetical protein n=1 Tax=Demequina silvatica TaxID=1638988 RepID=UPI0007863795|nr:hypothetical protein [Demequina silvatica]
MTAVRDDAAVAQAASAPEPSARRGVPGNPWVPTPRRTWIAVRVELERRRPGRRGWVALGLLALALAGVGVAVVVLAPAGESSIPMELLLLLMLVVGLVAAPSLAATSVNRDAAGGALAALQMTRLTAADIALGKLLAAWLVGAAGMLPLVPFLGATWGRSGWRGGALVVTVAAILLVVLAATAAGLAWSAHVASPSTSVAFAHLTTAALILGTLVLFAVTQPLVASPAQVSQRFLDYDAMTEEQQAAVEQAWAAGDLSGIDVPSLPCREESYATTVERTERTAWMLLANPVVSIAETAPLVRPDTAGSDGAAPGLFAHTHAWVSAQRLGPDPADLLFDECTAPLDVAATDTAREDRAMLAPAPWVGLGVQAVLLAAALAVTVRRLRLPTRRVS